MNMKNAQDWNREGPVWIGAVIGALVAALLISAALFSVQRYEPAGEPARLEMKPIANYEWNLIPAPAERVTEIKGAVSGWPVGAAVTWLDRYTASDMKRVKRCSGKAYRCITIRSGKVSGGAVGRIGNGVITIDTAKAASSKYRGHYRSQATRKWLVAHELGHAFGLKHGRGANLMNPTAGAGKLKLTTAQKHHLKGR
jgi:hypothetical protein